MIPKRIHYCWFGKAPLTKEAQKCINSWKKFMPDYEIIKWDESNFNINFCTYVQQAYQLKKWAFVSDVARFHILYTQGGIYFDTDVELIKSLEPIINNGGYIGLEKKEPIVSTISLELPANPGLGMAAPPGLELFKEILHYYKTESFLDKQGNFSGKTVVHITTETLIKHGLSNTKFPQFIDGLFIYPDDYFCPLDRNTGILNITNNTYSIHWFSASWLSNNSKFKLMVKRLIGPKLTNFLLTLKKFIVNTRHE